MAKETATTLFLGTDHVFSFEILNAAETAAVNITGWALSYMIKRHRSDTDASALLTRTTGAATIAISGTYNSSPAPTNTQVATVTIADTDTDAIQPGQAWWELKRTDAGSETVLAYGPITLQQSVHRS